MTALGRTARVRARSSRGAEGIANEDDERGLADSAAEAPLRSAVVDLRDEWLDRVASIRRWSRGGERAPHKPLLLLHALVGMTL